MISFTVGYCFICSDFQTCSRLSHFYIFDPGLDSVYFIKFNQHLTYMFLSFSLFMLAHQMHSFDLIFSYIFSVFVDKSHHLNPTDSNVEHASILVDAHVLFDRFRCKLSNKR